MGYNKNDMARMAGETQFLRDNLEKVLRLTDVLQEQGKEFKSRSPHEIRDYVLSASSQSQGRVLGDTSRSKKVLAEVLDIFDGILEECK